MAEEKSDLAPDSPDVHFEPIVQLAPVDTITLEEDEEESFKMRAKLYRYDTVAEPPEWKERGLGDIKILKHKTRETYRILMRREKTLKICCNHSVLPHMELKANCGSDRAWVWSTFADFADEESKPECLAIKFGSSEKAQMFKKIFEEAKQNHVPEVQLLTNLQEKQQDVSQKKNREEKASGDKSDVTSDTSEAEQLTDKLKNMVVKDADDKVKEETVSDQAER